MRGADFSVNLDRSPHPEIHSTPTQDNITERLPRLRRESERGKVRNEPSNAKNPPAHSKDDDVPHGLGEHFQCPPPVGGGG